MDPEQGRSQGTDGANPLRDEVIALIFFAVCVVLFLSNLKFSQMGLAGEYLRMVQLGLLGGVGYALPILMFLTVCFHMANRGLHAAKVKMVSLGVACLAATAFLQEFVGQERLPGESVLAYFTHSSEKGVGGGLLGGLVYEGLSHAVGEIGANVILGIVVLVAIVLISERSFVGALGDGSRKVVGRAKDSYANHKARAAAAKECEDVDDAVAAPGQGRARGGGLGPVLSYVPGGGGHGQGAYVGDETTPRPDADMGPVVGGAGRADPGADGLDTPVPGGGHWVGAEEGLSVGGTGLHGPGADGLYAAAPGGGHRGGVGSGPIVGADGIRIGIGQPGYGLDGAGLQVEGATYRGGAGTGPIVGVDVTRSGGAAIGPGGIQPGGPSAPGQPQGDGGEAPAAKPETPDPGVFVGSIRAPRDAQIDPGDGQGDSRIEEIASGDDGHSIYPLRQRKTLAEMRLKDEPDERGAYESGAYEDSTYEGDAYESAALKRGLAGVGADGRNRAGMGADERGLAGGDSLVAGQGKGMTGKGTKKASGIKYAAETGHPADAGGTEGALDEDYYLDEEDAPPVVQYRFPPLSLLKKPVRAAAFSEQECRATAIKLQKTLQNFGVGVTVTNISVGPTVTRYELLPEQNVRVNKLLSFVDDIKLSLATADIRVEAPIPGKSAIGIEVPNKSNATVYLRELLESQEFSASDSKLAFAVGKDIGGQIVVTDVSKMPHLLIAGATGSGKSVCINTLVMSMIYKYHPDDVKMIMIDPKVVELSVYNGIPHLLHDVVTDPKKAAGALCWAVAEMNERYRKFAGASDRISRVRELDEYNKKAEAGLILDEDGVPVKKLPRIVIIVDELNDLMQVARKEVEDAIIHLAQLARAAGLHLVIATQRPSADVITGVIKANVPSRIAFSVSSGTNSRIIIDMNGAETLLGKGDMLFAPFGTNKPMRVQGAFVSNDEVNAVVSFLQDLNMEAETVPEIETQVVAKSPGIGEEVKEGPDYDVLFEQAGRYIIEKEKASVGVLQRMFRIGFNRAARIMDQLAEVGVVGEDEGTKPRKILMNLAEFEDMLGQLRG
ncbi:MAG: DNA translocase FtsK [Lachnospiraceae bacterium]|jgi:hypothetical protein|nr:DNA translocase FtsK [Lachnospiraceae bacterium]